MIILYIGGQGNGREAVVQESKMVVPKRASLWTGPMMKKELAHVQNNRAPHKIQEAFVSRFLSILDAISSRLRKNSDSGGFLEGHDFTGC